MNALLSLLGYRLTDVAVCACVCACACVRTCEHMCACRTVFIIWGSLGARVLACARASTCWWSNFVFVTSLPPFLFLQLIVFRFCGFLFWWFRFVLWAKPLFFFVILFYLSYFYFLSNYLFFFYLRLRYLFIFTCNIILKDLTLLTNYFFLYNSLLFFFYQPFFKII